MVNAVSSLFPEVQFLILEQLPPATLRLMAFVNKHFATLALDNTLWKPHVQNDFPDFKYTFDWGNCFNEYSRLKRRSLKKMTFLQAQLRVAIEENILEEIKKVFSKMADKHEWIPFKMGRKIKEQNNEEMTQFFKDAIRYDPKIPVDDYHSSWKTILEQKYTFYNDASSIKLGKLVVDIQADTFKQSFLSRAASEGQVDFFKWLVPKFPHLLEEHSNYVFDAAWKGHFKFVKYYFETFSPAIDVNTLFLMSQLTIVRGHLATLEVLATYMQSEVLQRLLNSIVRDQDEKYDYNIFANVPDVSNKALDCMCYLIDKGADVNTKTLGTEKNRTPLYLAVLNESYHAAQFLLGKGANPNLDFPLDIAINQKMIELLLKHGAKTSEL